MKKITLAIGILASLAVCSSYGQGTVVFGNTGGSRISTNSVVGGAATGLTSAYASGGINFYYALFYSTAATTIGGTETTAVAGANGVYAWSDASWHDGSSTTGFSTNTAAGRLQPSTPNTDGSASIANLSGGTSAQMVVIGWSSNIGSTVAALEAYLADPTFYAWVGQSAVSGPLAPGTLGSTSPVTLFGASPNIPGFTLGLVQPVPEPATLALAALGGASLLLFRRKK